jgi:hypothetical protein
MKTISKVLLLGAVALSMLGAVLVLGPGSAGASPIGSNGDLQQATPTATVAPSTGGTTVQTGTSMAQEWDRFCVKKVPYTLIAIPENATFEVATAGGTIPTREPGGVSPGEFTCTAVGVFRGHQVVVCKGPQLTAFTLRVSADGESQDFLTGTTWCPIKDPSQYNNP